MSNINFCIISDFIIVMGTVLIKLLLELKSYLKHVRSSSLPSALADGEDPVKIFCATEFLKILKVFNWILGLWPRMTSSHYFITYLYKQYLMKRSLSYKKDGEKTSD